MQEKPNILLVNKWALMKIKGCYPISLAYWASSFRKKLFIEYSIF